MTGRAYLEDDSLQPEYPRTPGTSMLEWQVGINAQLMRRLDALERKVKELEHRQAV